VHHITILIVCIVILAASLAFQVNDDTLYLFELKWPIHCFMFKTLGIKCSLCGLTRSLVWFAHGNFTKSINSHRIGPAIFAFICLQVPYRIYALSIYPGKININVVRLNLSLAMLLAFAVLLNWLIYLGGLIL